MIYVYGISNTTGVARVLITSFYLNESQEDRYIWTIKDLVVTPDIIALEIEYDPSHCTVKKCSIITGE